MLPFAPIVPLLIELDGRIGSLDCFTPRRGQAATANPSAPSPAPPRCRSAPSTRSSPITATAAPDHRRSGISARSSAKATATPDRERLPLSGSSSATGPSPQEQVCASALARRPCDGRAAFAPRRVRGQEVVPAPARRSITVRRSQCRGWSDRAGGERACAGSGRRGRRRGRCIAPPATCRSAGGAAG